jgi:hypothetical protein
MSDYPSPLGPRPITGTGPAPAAAPAAPRNRPSATPMRIALGTGFLAIFSAIASAIVAPPQPTVGQPVDPSVANAGATPGAVVRPVVYMQLQPGQTAPPGAKVIDAAAPTPMTVVTVVPAPAQQAVVVKTTQSGKKVP